MALDLAHLAPGVLKSGPPAVGNDDAGRFRRRLRSARHRPQRTLRVVDGIGTAYRR